MEESVWVLCGLLQLGSDGLQEEDMATDKYDEAIAELSKLLR